MARRPSSAVVCAVVWCAQLAAQQRAPCAGVLRGEDNAPLAGAEVTFAFEPGIVTPGERDRVVVTTDAAGRFAADLVAGLVYTVWAIGPADSKGVRAMCRPTATAAAGWPLELVAAEQRGTVRVPVAGTAPWIAEGPLALRVFVAGSVALPRDVPLPGDGSVALPPCPTDVIALALLDGRGSLIDVYPVDLAAPDRIEFTAPREYEVVVHDDQGAPLAGARIVQCVYAWGPRIDPVVESGRLGERLLGTSDANGKAKVRTTFTHDGVRFLLLRAEAARHVSELVGWYGDRRTVRGGAAVAEGEQLRFELAAAVPVAARIVGLPGGTHAIGWYQQELEYALANGGGGGWTDITARTSAICDGLCTLASSTHGSFLRLWVPDGNGMHTHAWTSGQEAELWPVDLPSMRVFRVAVVDDTGQRVPGVQIAIASRGASNGTPWLDRFALPPDGRIALRVPRADLRIYATTATAHGIALVGLGDPAGEVHIALQPMPVLTVRVVDESGAPVAGARLVPTAGIFASSQQAEAAQLDAIAFERGSRQLGLARSDRAGMLRMHFPVRAGSTQRVIARAGRRASEELTLHPTGDVQQIVVR